MTVHHIKLDSRWFDAVASGVKTCEVCRTDRPYAVGDTLRLHERDGDRCTGRVVEATITHMLVSEDFPRGIREGYAVLSIRIRRRPGPSEDARCSSSTPRQRV